MGTQFLNDFHLFQTFISIYRILFIHEKNFFFSTETWFCREIDLAQINQYLDEDSVENHSLLIQVNQIKFVFYEFSRESSGA